MTFSMGIYTKMKTNVLYPVFASMTNRENNDATDETDQSKEGREYADELMRGIWYSELYKMFFKNSGGFYHSTVTAALAGCQMILFETYDGAGYWSIQCLSPAKLQKCYKSASRNKGYQRCKS